MNNEFEAKKILIVEDNLLNQKVIQMIVKKTGHIPIAAFDGKEAFTIAKREKPALILLDIKLIKVSGTEVGKKIKNDPNLKSIPIIVVTSLTDKDERKRIIKETRCDHYLTKPFLPDMLTDLIAKYCPIKDIGWS